MKRWLLVSPLVMLVSLLTASASYVSAQSYPGRPVRIIVTFPPGGSSDTLTRVLAQEMSSSMGQPVVIDNRPGAGGKIGMGVVANAEPDGYTLLSSSSSLPLASVLFNKLSFDPMRDFAPITMLGSSPMIVTVNPQFRAKSVTELIAMAKERPGAISYASGGYGTQNHLAVELLKSQTSIDLTHVPYRGNSLAAVDVISGEVPVFVDYMLTGLPHVREGKLRALATTGSKRLKALANIPTMDEAGVPGFEASLWFAFFGPAGTPPEIIFRLNKEIMAALAKPNVMERLERLGIDVVPQGPAELAKTMMADYVKWKDVVEKAGLKKMD